MHNNVKRIFVEKKNGFNVEANFYFKEFKTNLGVEGISKVRIINRYDIEGISSDEIEKAKDIIFREPPVDNVYFEEIHIEKDNRVFAIEYLPGQYDQRADSASQCIQILTCKERPIVKASKLFVIEGKITNSDFAKIKEYCINPVESHESKMEKPLTLVSDLIVPKTVDIVEGFINMNSTEIEQYMNKMGFAMSLEDLLFCQEYFKNTEKRNPTITELKVIDTYWSDHCRHTTFLTKINNITFNDDEYSNIIKDTYESYKKSRNNVYGNKIIEKDENLMDIAVIAMKEMRKNGDLEDLEVSDEINACSIIVDAIIDDKIEKWLVMFKNETHNHPTEIEPFGGAATCLGGAIRDPLSGRSYVYQAMRVTGSGDPRKSLSETIPGKLSQRKISTTAAAGYSSYGNQIGLATGQVAEIYHEGYVAKRMEIGAVVGAAPLSNVRRDMPLEGDKIILLGGRTGRDGCGGATGSSKEHNEESLLSCGAEVQKGNPPTERKIQRLFRKKEVSLMIKKCNDFGAGGVCVAIGELADGLEINLDKVLKKYEGLDGTELAISESQERMAVVVSSNDVDKFIEESITENLEAVVVANVTSSNRLIMNWNDNVIVNISRDFLNTNGVKQEIDIEIDSPFKNKSYFDKSFEDKDIGELWKENIKNLNICSQKGLVERFDSTIGANTVIMPFGGEYQLTPAEGMVAKLPVLEGNTKTCTLMTYGFNPEISSWSPFHGGVYSILESISKIVSLGGDFNKVRLTLQEYFEKLGKNKQSWGKPLSALLGAFFIEKGLNIPAIGGKDSMSGTFKDMNVPPTLVSFALTTDNVENIISNEFKNDGNKVIILKIKKDKLFIPDIESIKLTYNTIKELIDSKHILSASAVKMGGVAETISKMSFGNKIGFEFEKNITKNDLFYPEYGAIVIEVSSEFDIQKIKELQYKILGKTIKEKSIIVNKEKLNIDDLVDLWSEPLEKVFPTKVDTSFEVKNDYLFNFNIKKNGTKVKPRVFIPVFPGNNCEYDTEIAFKKANALTNTFVIKNINAIQIEESIKKMVNDINNSQIIMIPGGFSAGDEPDGSGKFIATAFRNPYIKEAVNNLIKNRDGLILGICNGFQALIKLGLVPYGEIVDIKEDSPTLTYNTIGRHISKIVTTKIVSNLSPWLSNLKLGELHKVAVSHGEGRFVASNEIILELKKKGQIATQYSDLIGNPSSDINYNPNGSVEAIEGITSPDGRVFGKMGHSERYSDNVFKNIPGNKNQDIFESGVKYFI